MVVVGIVGRLYVWTWRWQWTENNLTITTVSSVTVSYRIDTISAAPSAREETKNILYDQATVFRVTYNQDMVFIILNRLIFAVIDQFEANNVSFFSLECFMLLSFKISDAPGVVLKF